jgi:hypothetical protein
MNIENLKSSTNQKNNNSLKILVRIAVYDNLRSIPRIIDLNFVSIDDFINNTAEKIYSVSREQGGRIPFTIIKEVVENLIHANFSEIVITILNNGNKIMISDQGPGIPDKERAVQPGFTSATSEMKKYIRGVGSGLPIVKETISFSGGSIDIKDNIKNGTVVILSINTDDKNNEYLDLSIGELKNDNAKLSSSDKNNFDNVAYNNIHNIKDNKVFNANIKNNASNANADDAASNIDIRENSNIEKASNFKTSLENNVNEYLIKKEKKQVEEYGEFRSLKLTLRQIKILYLVLELEEVGPSIVSKELGFSLSTSFRELSFLEKKGLLKVYSSGKKRLSKKGTKYLEYYSNSF